jgi:hypothetical protein
MYIYIYIYAYLYTYINIFLFIHIHIYIYIYMYIYIYVYMYTHIGEEDADNFGVSSLSAGPYSNKQVLTHIVRTIYMRFVRTNINIISICTCAYIYMIRTYISERILIQISRSFFIF